MFVRKKKNRSGSVSVQVIDKSKAYRVIKTIGSSKDPEQISRMFELAKLFIDHQNKQYSLFPQDQQNNAAVLDFIRNRRIEAHVLIAFVAYTIYKELERQLEKGNLPISPQRAIELTQTMYELRFELPDDPKVQHILLKMDAEQQILYDLLYWPGAPMLKSGNVVIYRKFGSRGTNFVSKIDGFLVNDKFFKGESHDFLLFESRE